MGIIPCCYLYKNWKLTRGNLDRDLYPRENPREIINRLPYPERNQLPIANPGGYIYQEPNSEMSILSESFHWMNRYPNVGRNLPPSENLINNLYQERNLIRNIQPIENPNHVRNPLPIGNLGNQIPHLERNIPAVPGPNPNKSPRHKKRSSRCNSKAIRTKTLKSVKFHSKMRFDGDPICTIDMSDFTTGELAIIIPTCKHIFHSPCITEWLNSGARKYCPNCRSDLTGWTFSSNLD